MFLLSEADLTKRILGCGDGPASFNSELTKRGGIVVSVDPLYAYDADDIRRRIGETFDTVICANVLHYTGFPGLQELYRVTKTDGRMLLAFLERSRYTRRSIDLAISVGLFPPFMREAPLFDISDFRKLGATIEDSATVIGLETESDQLEPEASVGVGASGTTTTAARADHIGAAGAALRTQHLEAAIQDIVQRARCQGASAGVVHYDVEVQILAHAHRGARSGFVELERRSHDLNTLGIGRP